MKPDYRLYLIAPALTPLEVVEAALRGGVTMLQLREKELPLAQTLEAGRRLRALAREHGVPFLVNDRADLALLLEADGLHVGQEDLPVREARRLLGQEAIIGVSAASAAEGRQAEAGGADYLGAGSVFPTPSKADAGAPIGTEGLRAVAAATSLPVVGIGGITAANAGSVMAAGAAGVAVISAILKTSQPEAAARQLWAAILEGGRRWRPEKSPMPSS